MAHDFEDYVTVLTSLLRMRSARRSAIVEELRDHLQQRLEELTAQGVTAKEAIAIAMSEFGDAAALAAAFTAVDWNRRRRWMMRCTAVSVVVVLAAVLAAVAFWPAAQAPFAPEAIAQSAGEQDKRGASLPATGSPAAAEMDGELSDQVRAKLVKRVDVEFMETPLGDALTFLAEKAGVQIYLKRRALDDVGITPLDPVTFNLAQIPIDMALDLMLDELQLDYTIDRGIVVVSTPEDIEMNLQVAVYNVRDLLADLPSLKCKTVERPFKGEAAGISAGGGVQCQASADQLIEPADQLITTIVATIEPTTWDEVGGPGSISMFGQVLVVQQTRSVHDKIADLLRKIREVKQDKHPAG